MKKFASKVLLFFLIVGIIDVSYGMAYDYMNSHAKGGENKRIFDLCKIAQYDIIVMGSSRAHHHYVPSIIEKTTGLSCYNAGIDGNGVILAYGLLQQILKRYNPKLIVFDVEPAFDINIYAEDNNRTRYLSLQKPYYRDKEVAEIFKDISCDEYYKVHSGLYRYNSASITGLSSFLFGGNNDDQNGYVPLFGEMIMEPASGKVKSPNETDEVKLKYLRNLIKLTQENRIPLIMIASPNYSKVINRRLPVFDIVKEMCNDNKVFFLDYYRSPNFMSHKELFNEPMHLNDAGARLFTELIAEKINIIITK